MSSSTPALDYYSNHPAMSRARGLAGREELYRMNCHDILDLRQWVKTNSAMAALYPNVLPVPAKLREPTGGEDLTQQDHLDYVRALVTEARALDVLVRQFAGTHDSPSLTTMTEAQARGKFGYEDTFNFCRSLVRQRELCVDWKIEVVGNQHKIDAGKELLHTSRFLSPDDLEELRNEIKVWEDGFPAVKADWETFMKTPFGAQS